MTDHITPELLVALDLASDREPTKATLDYLKTHKAPSLARETRAFQKRFKQELPGRKPKIASSKLSYQQMRDRISKRRRTWKRYADHPETRMRYLKRWAKEGFDTCSLAKITGKTEVELVEMLREANRTYD